MDAPLRGSNHVVLNRISNLEQAAAVAGKLFLVSEDRLKILESLAKEVCHMCEELYKGEILPSESARHVYRPPTQENMVNTNNGEVKSSADEKSGSREEEEPAVQTQNREGDILLDPGGSGGMNDNAQTQPEMTESAGAMKVEEDQSTEGSEWQMLQGNTEHDRHSGDNVAFNNATRTQPATVDSASAMKVDDDVSNDRSEWQVLQIKTEPGSDIDPVNDAAVKNVEHNQPETMESAILLKDEDVSAEGSEWQITDIRTEQDTDSGHDVGSCLTRTDLKPSDRENVPSGPTAAVTKKNAKKGKKCADCGKMFKRQFNLDRHRMSHTGEKPCICPQCGRAFAVKSTLLTHMRTHTGEKPYKCPECGKAFNDHSNLARHRKMHTGETSFVCGECGRTFAQRKSLVLHMRAHPREES